jgi:hypothetical protein
MVTQCRYSSDIYLEWMRRTTKTSVKTASVPAEVRSELHQNTREEPYRCKDTFAELHFDVQ